MARKLDKHRPFGEVYGHESARYEQHGILFDTEGNELPGFEKVKVPEPAVIVVAGDDSALRGQIVLMAETNARLKNDLEDNDAKIEEIQGKLDSANVEIARLTAPEVKKDEAKQGKLDDQLKAQGIK